jgi:hypothetical protein
MNLKTLISKNGYHCAKMLSVYIIPALAFMFFTSAAFASEGSGLTIKSIADGYAEQMSGIVTLVTALGYAGGIALGILAIVKFNAHRNMPTQVTLSHAVVPLVVAAGLVWFVSSFGAIGASGGLSESTGSSGNEDPFSDSNIGDS